MKDSYRAAMLSAFLFPGTGQLMVQKRWLAGTLYLLINLSILAWFCLALYRRVGEAISTIQGQNVASLPEAALGVIQLILAAPGKPVIISFLLMVFFWVVAVGDALLFDDRSRPYTP